MMRTESDPLLGLIPFSMLYLCLFLMLLAVCLPATATASPVADSPAEWGRLTKELTTLGLPTRFLRLLPPEFVKL
jgi:hypothetical protein